MNRKSLLTFFSTLLLSWIICTPILTAQYCGRVEYSTKDGVIQPMIKHPPLQDSEGNLWVASRGGGVNVFDGKKWKNYTEEDGLGHPWILPKFEDKEGGIWLVHGYDGGVSRFINGEFQQFIPLSDSVDSLQKGQKQFPYYCKNSALLNYNAFKQIPIAYQIDSHRQIVVYEFDYQTQSFDLEGSVLLDSTDLIKHFSSNHPMLSVTLGSDAYGEYYGSYFIEGNFYQIYKNEKKRIFPAATANHHSWFFEKPNHSFSSIKKEDNKLWIYENEKWEVLSKPNIARYGEKYQKLNFEYERIYTSSWRDYDKAFFSTWKITNPEFEHTYLLAEYDPQTLEIINTLLFFEDRILGSFIKDKAGTYWYCNGKSVVRLFPNQIHIPSGVRGMPTEAWAVTQSDDGKIWFSSNGSGLVNFDGLFLNQPKQFSNYLTFNNGATNDILTPNISTSS
jgi:hypothetical protein